MRVVIGHRSQYASGAKGQRGHVEEVWEGEGELLCTYPIVEVTMVTVEETPDIEVEEHSGCFASKT